MKRYKSLSSGRLRNNTTKSKTDSLSVILYYKTTKHSSVFLKFNVVLLCLLHEYQYLFNILFKYPFSYQHWTPDMIKITHHISQILVRVVVYPFNYKLYFSKIKSTKYHRTSLQANLQVGSCLYIVCILF